MNATEFESDELQFCPLCQVPLKLLKIIPTIHVNMCDVLWDELPDCSDGIQCHSESVFHYRDFSHKTLANHRENLRKRKIEDPESRGDLNAESATKPKLRRVIDRLESEDNDDDIFVSNTPRKTHSRKPKTGKKSHIKKKGTVETIPQDRNIEDIVTKICLSLQPEETDGLIISTENNRRNDNEINDSFVDDASECSLSQNNESKNDEGVQENVKENLEDACSSSQSDDSKNNDGVQESVIEDLEDADEASESLMSWENLTNEIDENVDRKEKCKAQWNNLFKGAANSGNTKSPSANANANKKQRNSMFSSAKEIKVCPSFKKMPGTSFAVDAFQFGNIPGITHYFLSHFHADHYIGLKKSFSNPIYCSLITANLVKKKIRVAEKFLHVLHLNDPIVISRVEVTCFDANHCPGAVLFLFRLTSGEQFLHVGDFRACPEMEDIPQLRNNHIDRLYLDTTYFNPDYVFPTQNEVIERVKKIVRSKLMKHEKALFISGTYLIGKEKVFIGMFEELQCLIWAQPQKVDVFRCLEDYAILSALTSVPELAKVHVLPMNHLRFDRLKKYLLDLNGAFTHIFAFRPTGWEMGRRAGSEDWLNETTQSNITIYGIPYSEHSNYEELCRFIKFIKADKVIPTVPMKNRQMYGLLKSVVDSYKVGPKQQGIQQFFNSSS